jgi:hypothetical protein
MITGRDILIRFECREQCAERGEPSCFDLGPRLDPPVKFEPCELCARLTDARIEALAAAGFKVLGREPTEAMVDATDETDVYWGYWADGRPGGPDAIWRLMFDAAAPAQRKDEK